MRRLPLAVAVLVASLAPGVASATVPQPATRDLRDALQAWTALQHSWHTGTGLALQATDDNIGECDTAREIEAQGSDPDWPNVAKQAERVSEFIATVDDQIDLLQKAAKVFPDTVKSLNVVRRNRVESATGKIQRSLKAQHNSIFELILAPGVIRKDHNCAAARAHRAEAVRLGSAGYGYMVDGWETLARVAGIKPPKPGDFDP